MEININNFMNFSVEDLTKEKEKLEKKILNMEYMPIEEINLFAAINEELKKRSEQ